jgi:hypothetical protein
MRDVYLVAAVRTPIGKRGGGLSEAHPVNLGAHVLRELANRKPRPQRRPTPGRPADAFRNLSRQRGVSRRPSERQN